ncbi:60S ribosomal protein L4 [Thalictrum thalictroides]|uniref:60S ribosomal protein L4 n=1 Tax=Thalictrum thalictroides TaxID=46969 RepID=A0A7J6XAG6_THATH|nr:60S ribosomal protein L4 [Thalictrum thalictroides]
MYVNHMLLLSRRAGHKKSAESAVSRVPGGNLASAVPSLVLARGHKIEQVPAASEIPLVVADSAEGVDKTSPAIKLFKQICAVYPDAEKAKDSQTIRSDAVA